MQRYTLRQLEYLVACVDHGSIAQAAEALNVAQPTISVAITKLEAQFGVQLLIRHHSHGVSPTVSAEKILQSARSLLAHAEDLQRQAILTGTTVTGELRLGSFSTLAPAILPGMVHALRLEYPGIDLRIREGTQEHLLDALYSGQIDVALVYDIDLPDDLRRVRLDARAPYAALPEEHPLSRQADVSLAELVEHPMILLDVPPSRDYFLGLFRDAGLEPQIAYSSPSLELVRGLVGRGLGYSVLVTRPQHDQTYDGRRHAVLPLRDRVPKSTIVLASLARLRATRLQTSFEDVAVRALQGSSG
ncbi:LysR family transcriptional regulator [Rhodobacteraceae bacterium NNCM2]|nr:LysR family transcriptional regulator [Coraliihabitans acroporae]